MMQAMIFAAGLGTRLKPLTDTMPKALVPVGGEPLLGHVVRRLKAAGCERIVVNVHHFAQQIIDYVAANDGFGVDLRISDERERLLETGGGIRHALPLLDRESPVLIHNVDILSNVDLKAFYAEGCSGADATLLVSERHTKRYLLFSADEEHRLLGWTNIDTHEARPEGFTPDPASQLMRAFSGIHMVAPSLFPALEAQPDRFPIMQFYLAHCQSHVLRGTTQEGMRLLDVGKQDTLIEAERFINALQT